MNQVTPLQAAMNMHQKKQEGAKHSAMLFTSLPEPVVFNNSTNTLHAQNQHPCFKGI